MGKTGFIYPSKIIKLTVHESDGGDAVTNNPSEHAIHECVLLQLPYFETLLSERWRNSVSNDFCLELPPLLNVEDFNTLIESLYRGSSLPPATDVKRAVGISLWSR
jgi:hypothetical protein